MVLQNGNYIAWAFASLSVYLIKFLGWRKTFAIQAAASGIIGMATLLTVKEPKRNTKNQSKDEKSDKPVEDEVDPNYTAEEM